MRLFNRTVTEIVLKICFEITCHEIFQEIEVEPLPSSADQIPPCPLVPPQETSGNAELGGTTAGFAFPDPQVRGRSNALIDLFRVIMYFNGPQ